MHGRKGRKTAKNYCESLSQKYKISPARKMMGRSKQRLRNSEVSEFTRINAASTLNDLLRATMLRIRVINHTLVGYVSYARFSQMQALLLSSLAVSPQGFTPQAARHRRAEPPPEKKKNPIKSGSYYYHLVELKAAKTHTVLYQINRTEYYCQIDLPRSDYPLYGKQLVASRSKCLAVGLLCANGCPCVFMDPL